MNEDASKGSREVSSDWSECHWALVSFKLFPFPRLLSVLASRRTLAAFPQLITNSSKEFLSFKISFPPVGFHHMTWRSWRHLLQNELVHIHTSRQIRRFAFFVVTLFLLLCFYECETPNRGHNVLQRLFQSSSLDFINEAFRRCLHQQRVTLIIEFGVFLICLGSLRIHP